MVAAAGGSAWPGRPGGRVQRLRVGGRVAAVGGEDAWVDGGFELLCAAPRPQVSGELCPLLPCMRPIPFPLLTGSRLCRFSSP